MDTLLPLRYCLRRWKNLTSLSIRLSAPFQAGAIRVLLAPFLDQQNMMTVLAPKLVHVSFPHLFAFFDDTATDSSRENLVDAIMTATALRKAWTLEQLNTLLASPRPQSPHDSIALIRSLAVPCCVLGSHGDILRADLIINQLYCLCGGRDWDENGDVVDPDSGWSWEEESWEEHHWGGGEWGLDTGDWGLGVEEDQASEVSEVSEISE
ncbi:hypothetical protein DL93DRAFT_2229192, partial [Clavulina sp. PMI_390]